ncbi:DUF2304 domain-containing protein [Antribacter gilvus]|uniref:DUF2304 domain-containing protein n=1 Tax=Antribacter gilvus TaxID=2304675 RepID=UPI000F7873E5|nr:DUF2304 domain-containing protein [Antribacter gilvus]
MTGYLIALATCIAFVASLVLMLRNRRLKEKYAATWIILAVGICIVGALPVVVEWLADLVGVETPSNLLFAVALVVLLGVCIQLSTEVTALEEETRTLVEEVALLRHDVEQLATAAPRAPQGEAALTATEVAVAIATTAVAIAATEAAVAATDVN